MALSGTITGSYQATGYRILIEWSATQNISDNQSTVTANVYFDTKPSYNMISSASKTVTTTIDTVSSSKTEAGLANNSGGQKKLIHTYSRTITHEPDGKKSLTIESSFVVNIQTGAGYVGTLTASGNVTLDAIPRSSTITSNANWTAPNNFTISISRASSTFTHTVRIYVKDSGGTDRLIKTITGVGTSTSSSFTQAQNTDIFNRLAQATSRGSRVEVDTLSDGVKIGSTAVVTGTCTAATASTISANSSFNIGNSISVSISRADSSLTHTVRLRNGTTTISGTQYTGQTTSTSISTSGTVATTIYNLTPNSNTLGLNIECITYYNGVQVRSPVTRNITANVTNSNPTFNSNWTYEDINTNTFNLTGNNQMIVQNHSSVRATITTTNKADAVNGATMVGYYATLNGVRRPTTGNTAWSSTSTLTFDFGTVSSSTNVTLTIRAIDSRGNWTETTKTVTILPYSIPVVTTSATRLNNFEAQTTVTLSGSISPLTVGGVRKNGIVLTQYRTKLTTTSTWGAWTNFSGNTLNADGTYSRNNVTLTLNNEQAFNIEVKTQDSLQTTTVARIIPVGQPIFFIDDVKKSIGVNCFPSGANMLDVNGNISMSGGVLGRFNPIYISSNSDLNNYQTAGMYYNVSNAETSTIANTPVNLAFSLLVERHAGITQTFTTYYNTQYMRKFVRNFYNGTWGMWLEIPLIETPYDSGWVDLSLQNGVTLYSTNTVLQYRKLGRVVYIRGALTNITAINTDVATLPVGFRPITQNHIFTMQITTISNNARFARWAVGIGGNIRLENIIDNTFNSSHWYPCHTSFVSVS